MSSNNYLLIKKDKIVKKYLLLEMDAEGDSMIQKIGLYNNLKNACRKAQEVMNEGDIEYGVHFRI